MKRFFSINYLEG